MSRRKGDDRIWIKGRNHPNARIKDITIPNTEDKKKVIYWDSIHRFEQLKVKLKYDNLKQSEFFRIVSQAYIDDDPYLASFVADYKEKMEIHNQTKRKKSKKLLKRGEQAKRNFRLGDEDIENIFDLIAKEHPDL